MLTPMSITSLDQGRALARWNVERLYTGRSEPASAGVVAMGVTVDVAEIETAAAQPVQLSWLGRVRAFFDAGYPFATRQV